VTTEWQNRLRRVISQVNAAKSDPRLSATLPRPKGIVTADSAISILDGFEDCLRYLKSRRRPLLGISDEYQLQDFLFLMLKGSIQDLTPENPTDRVASRFSSQDFLSKSLALVVEAKFIRDKKHGRSVTRELHDDIEMYRTHPSCSTLVFFLYDPQKFIPSVDALRRHIEGERRYEGKVLTVRCLVKS